MEQRDPKLWQVKAGNTNTHRDYSRFFVKYGLFCVGDEPACAHIANRDISEGDLIILAMGISKVVAVGRVVSRNGTCLGELPDDVLTDFDGWELPSFCNVEWYRPIDGFRTEGLMMGNLFARARNNYPALYEDAHNSCAPDRVFPVESMPVTTKEVADEALIDELVKMGLRPANAEELTTAIRRIRRLASYYQKYADGVLEGDIRAFLVIPLLLALGWSEQQIKLELNKADVTCFERAYQRHADRPKTPCKLLIETKQFSFGLDVALSEAAEYANTSFPEARVIAASNGYCYAIRRKRPEESSFPTNPERDAYLNLMPGRVRDRFPLDPQNVDGALSAFKALMPGEFL